jgi:hypothetical protein
MTGKEKNRARKDKEKNRAKQGKPHEISAKKSCINRHAADSCMLKNHRIGHAEY